MNRTGHDFSTGAILGRTPFRGRFWASGFYAWADLMAAEAYQAVLVERGVAGVEVIRFDIAEADLTALITFDMTMLSDDAANGWLYAHSMWSDPEPRRPHDYDHVIRGTYNGNHEHYFSPAAFAHFRPADTEPEVRPAVQGH